MSMINIARRNWVRLSVVFNVCIVLYFCTNLGTSGPWVEEPPSNWAASGPISEAFQQQQNNASQKSIVASSSSAAAASSSSAPAEDARVKDVPSIKDNVADAKPIAASEPQLAGDKKDAESSKNVSCQEFPSLNVKLNDSLVSDGQRVDGPA